MRKGQHHVLENSMVGGALPIVPYSLDVPKMLSRPQEASASGQHSGQVERTHTSSPGNESLSRVGGMHGLGRAKLFECEAFHQAWGSQSS